jgi:hypothetical protein
MSGWWTSYDAGPSRGKPVRRYYTEPKRPKLARNYAEEYERKYGNG